MSSPLLTFLHVAPASKRDACEREACFAFRDVVSCFLGAADLKLSLFITLVLICSF